jgi:hypothetical protein
MTRSHAALLLALAGLLSSCTKLFDTASLDPLSTAEGYCKASYDAHYAFSVRCEGYDPGWAAIRPRFWYEEACAPTGVSVAAGRMTYDRASGEACLAAYAAAASCEEPIATLPACALALQPAVTTGGACTRYGECLAALTCTSPDGTCPGHCAGFLALGERCDGGVLSCGPGLWCDGGGICAQRLSAGQLCASALCMENLYCDGTICSYVAGPGESCATTPCDASRNVYCSAGTCRAVPAYGEPCGEGDRCATGLYCRKANNTCYTPPTVPVADGQPCVAPDFCGPYSFCDTSLPTALCAPRKPVDAVCRDGSECLQPAHCDLSGPPGSWRCKPPAVAGSTCEPGGCATGTWCQVTSGTIGVCTVEADLGQPCGQIGIGEGTGCVRGYCALANPTDLAGVCRREGEAGAPCTESYQCRSFNCDTAVGRCLAPTCPLN